jgi:hypothetical protein
MPEGRILKKAVSQSRRLSLLSSDTYRLIYTWLIPHLDIEGRFSANPEVIKGMIVPRIRKITLSVIEKALLEMHDVGLITLYNIDGDRFLELRKFKDHQNLDLKREAPSHIPALTAGVLVELSPSGQGVVPDILGENSPVSKVKESKVKEREATPKVVATFFTTIQKYFTSAYKKKFGKEPAIDFGKDGYMVRQKEGLFQSPEEAFQLIDGFLDSKKAEECGYTLSVCFSSHTINLWRAGKFGTENNLSVNNPKWKNL